jgi:uncharacterized protein (UPF0261 family)
MGEELSAPRILIVGTGDTKSDELMFMADTIRSGGGMPVMVDVSVLRDPPYKPDFNRRDIAAAANTTIEAIIDSGDEHTSMALMSEGAVNLVKTLHDAGQVDGVLMLGGSMGTDLALDVANALPLGLPKFVISTIAYSHLLPPDRIAPDLMMILWSGGLYGLNAICRSILSQAAGAILGATRYAERVVETKPLIGMTSLGSSCLKYMKFLKPELEKRGYDVAVFHATGMGGRAFEHIAAKRGFAAVFDFCVQEVTNHQNGTVVTSGPDRLENAGKAGVPQIVAPGAADMVDLPAWQALPVHLADRPYHMHNRLLASVTTSPDGRRQSARLIADKLARATGPSAFILPLLGLQEWDQEGEPLHDPEGLQAFSDEIRNILPANVAFSEVAAHINEPDFSIKAMEIFDNWVENGVVPKGRL